MLQDNHCPPQKHAYIVYAYPTISNIHAWLKELCDWKFNSLHRFLRGSMKWSSYSKLFSSINWKKQIACYKWNLEAGLVLDIVLWSEEYMPLQCRKWIELWEKWIFIGFYSKLTEKVCFCIHTCRLIRLLHNQIRVKIVAKKRTIEYIQKMI